MQVIQPKDSFDRRYLPAIAVLGLLIVVIPVVEWIGGNRPWEQPDARFSRDGILSGDAARVIETRFADNSVVSAWIRPHYNEILFRAFNIVTERVVVGRDGWLFEASNVKNYPPPRRGDEVARHVESIAEVVAWFERQGSDVLLLCVPNKWALYPDKLPKMKNPPSAVYREIQRHFLESGLEFVDSTEALDPKVVESFLPNDTHWTDEGARRVAAAIAGHLREKLAGSIPGRVIDAEYKTHTGHLHQGDLQRMLGFAPESEIQESLSVTTTRIVGVLKGSGARIRFDDPEDVVLCGTSFSHSSDLPALLSVELQLAVQNLSLAGKGPTKTLLELADLVRSGKRSAPKLIVWEFPEKHLFTRNRDFIEPLEDFLTSVRHEISNEYIHPARLAIKNLRPVNLNVQQTDDGDFDGRPTNGDPQLIYDLEVKIPGDGSNALTWLITPERRTRAKVVFDWGKGFERDAAVPLTLAGGGRATRIFVPIKDLQGRLLRRIRIDPVDTKVDFRMSAVELRTR